METRLCQFVALERISISRDSETPIDQLIAAERISISLWLQ
jgi:hypothetical protein